MSVRPMTPSDIDSWVEMRRALWPEGGAYQHFLEATVFFEAGDAVEGAALIAEEDGRAVGLAEVSIRPYAEGCRTNRVGFLEGWYVVPDARRRGVGAALVAAAEEWARAQGCTELASDTEPDNHVSAEAHRALGFTDVGLVRCFRKDL